MQTRLFPCQLRFLCSDTTETLATSPNKERQPPLEACIQTHTETKPVEATTSSWQTLQCEKRREKSTWTHLNTVLPLLPKSCLWDQEDIVNFHEKGIHCSHHVVTVTKLKAESKTSWFLSDPTTSVLLLGFIFTEASVSQAKSISVFFMTANRCSVFSWSWTSLLHPALRQQFVNQGKNNIGATPPHSCHGLSAEIQSCRRLLALLSATMCDHLGKAQHALPRRAWWWCRCGTFWLWMRCSVSLYLSRFPVTETTQQCVCFSEHFHLIFIVWQLKKHQWIHHSPTYVLDLQCLKFLFGKKAAEKQQHTAETF